MVDLRYLESESQFGLRTNSDISALSSPIEWSVLNVGFEGRSLTEVVRQQRTFDLETRRMARLATASRAERANWNFDSPNLTDTPPDQLRRVRPIHASSGGLEVLDAAPGSLHLLVVAIGLVNQALASEPAQNMTVLLELLGGARRLTGWVRKLPLFRQRQMPGTFSEFDNLVSEIIEQGPPSVSVSPLASIRAADGTLLQGRQVEMIQHHVDGTITVYRADSGNES